MSTRNSVRAAAAALLVAGSACAHPSAIPRAGDSDPDHPAVLVGEWIDLAHTTVTDSMFWILSPNGDDGSLEVKVVEGPSGQRLQQQRRHYGRWSLTGQIADTLARRLCFVRRPGRNGPSCVEFRIDSVQTDAGSRRRLSLKGYRGEHRTRDRELLERRR